MKDICFFTIVDDNLYYPIGTHIMINSFKRFHPDIDLIVFRQNTVDEIFAKEGINFYQAKPTFAKLLVNDYKRVVNCDADHIFLGRADAIIDGKYDDLPEGAFLYVGTIEEALEKANKMK